MAAVAYNGGGGGGSLSFLQRFCHLRLFQLILINGLCRELKKMKIGLCLKQFGSPLDFLLALCLGYFSFWFVSIWIFSP